MGWAGLHRVASCLFSPNTMNTPGNGDPAVPTLVVPDAPPQGGKNLAGGPQVSKSLETWKRSSAQAYGGIGNPEVWTFCSKSLVKGTQHRGQGVPDPGKGGHLELGSQKGLHEAKVRAQSWHLHDPRNNQYLLSPLSSSRGAQSLAGVSLGVPGTQVNWDHPPCDWLKGWMQHLGS